MDTEDVKKIAMLARLEIPDNELGSLAADMTNILHLVDKMNEVDTTEIAPLAHPLEIKQRLRADKPDANNERDHFQKIAPKTEAGLYLVPQVIE